MLGLNVLICVLVILDQVSKWMVSRYIPLHHEYEILSGFFSLTHVHNPGAAWGILAAHSWGTAVLAVISFVLGILLFFLVGRCKEMSLRLTLALIFAGSAGNLIDRVVRSYVVDFFHFRFGGWSFPSFNLADSYIVCGSIVLFFLLLQDRYFHDLASSLPFRKKSKAGGGDK